MVILGLLGVLPSLAGKMQLSSHNMTEDGTNKFFAIDKIKLKAFKQKM
jgi:hypothetical protein